MTEKIEVLFRFGICIVSIWCISFIWRIGKRYFLARNIPNIGLIKHLWILFIVGKEIPEMVSEMPPKPLYTLFCIFVPSYVVACPEYIRKILNSNASMNKHVFYDFLENLNQGLFTSTVQTWRKHKKLISPSFNKHMIIWFAETFDEESDILIDIFNKNVGVKNFNFYDVLLRYNFNTICKTTLGLDMNVQGERRDLVELFEKIMELQNYRLLRPWLHNYYVWKLSWHGRQFCHVMDKFNAAINTKMNENAKLKEKDQKLPQFGSQRKKDMERNTPCILDSLITNPSISQGEIIGEIHTFIFGGSETLSTTMSYLLIVLGMFKVVQEKLYDEITEIFGNDGPITVEGLSKMYYSERVIKETLRIFPIVGLMGRNTTEDMKLGDTVIPESSGVIINIFMIHRNPEYWPDPLKFDPDRFLPEEIAKRHPYTYLPFSLGPRMCIGYRYGMLNLKMTLAKVVRKFKIYTEYKTIEEVKLIFRLTIRPKDGEKVWLELR